MTWILTLFILASQCIIFSATYQFNKKEFFRHTGSYAFFSEKYCGIVLEFARAPESFGIFDAIIKVNKSMIPYELSIQYWDNYEYCPNFEIIKKPKIIRQQKNQTQLNLFKSRRRFSIIFFSRFANVTDFHAQISFFNETKKIRYDVALEYNLSKSILLDAYDLVVPQTVEEGRQYYSNFTEILLNRSIAFHKNPVTCSAHITTFPRSGTHFVSRMIEEITGEWVGMFPGYNYVGMESKDQINFAFIPYIKTFVDHGSRMNCLRSIKLVRDILESTDSLYHKARTHSHHNKLTDDYYKKSDYFNYMLEQLEKQLDQKKYHPKTNVTTFRYEDIMIDPLKNFQEIMTFVLGYPVQHTIYNTKIEEVIRTKGIASSYKTLSKDEAEIKSKTDLINLVPSNLVEYIFIHYAKYNHYYGYFNKYHQYMIEHNMDYEKNTINAEIKSIKSKYQTDKEINIKKVAYKRGYLG